MEKPKNKTVVITGTSSGFGKIAVKDFADKGYKVFATMRNIEGKNASNRSELETYSPNITVVEMDVINTESVKRAFDGILQTVGTVDILINNAGIMYIGPAEGYSVALAHEQMDTNYYGLIRVTQAVLPIMRKAGKGLIINTTSVVGRVSFPFGAIYNASKFAAEAYSQCLKYEVANQGIEVILVEPGPFGTGLIGSIKEGDRSEALAENHDLVAMNTKMLEGFSSFFDQPDFPKPQLVSDTYIELAEMGHGTRPTRTVVGLDFGALKINELSQPIQDEAIRGMDMAFMLKTKVN